VVFAGDDPLAFAAAIGSGLPGIYALHVGGGVNATVPDVGQGALVVYSLQDVRVISSTKAGESTLTFEASVSVATQGSLAVAGDFQALAFQSTVTVKGEGASLSVNGSAQELAFKNTVLIDGEGASLSVTGGVQNLTFERSVSIKGEAASLSVTGSVQELAFEASVSVASQASLTFTGTGDGDGVGIVSTEIILLDGASLTLVGDVAVPTISALVPCIVYAITSCTLSDGVTTKLPNGEPALVSLTNGSGGALAATSQSDGAVSTLKRDLNNGGLVGTGAYSDMYTMAALPVWDSRDGSNNGASPVVNAHGNTFKLFKLTAVPFTYTEAGFQLYRAVCTAYGLRIVVSGYSTSYYEPCAATYNCMPLPTGTDANGQYWGSSSNVDDMVRTVTGWTDFVIKHWSSNYPYNNPSDSGGWDTDKGPVCGLEL
jgi:hypothetical protein